MILDEQKRGHPLDEIDEVARVEDLTRHAGRRARDLRRLARSADYIVRLVNATRNHPDVYLGASPRGSLALYRAGQAYAALSGRDYVIPDDIKALAEPALAHRLIIKTAAIDPRRRPGARSSASCSTACPIERAGAPPRARRVRPA